MITKETAVKYTTPDGREFFDEDEARLHDAELDLASLLDRFGYNGMQKGAVVEMLVEHSHQFAELVGKIEVFRSKITSKGARSPYQPVRETM